MKRKISYFLILICSCFQMGNAPSGAQERVNVDSDQQNEMLVLQDQCKASNGQWVEATGEAVLAHVTPERAQQMALNRARIRGIERICGIRLQESAIVRDSIFAGAYLASQSEGFVIAENVLGWEYCEQAQSEGEAPVFTVKVRLQACIACQNIGRDPQFKIRAVLNKSVYVSGEKAEISIQANQDCYVYVFNIMADNLVRSYVPSQRIPKVRIEAGEEFIFPGKSLKLEMHTLPDHAIDHEAFVIIATKNQDDFAFLFQNGRDVPLTDFLGELVSIPISERVEKFLVYEIRK